MYRGTLNHQVLIFRVKLNDAILQEFRVSRARTVHAEFQRFSGTFELSAHSIMDFPSRLVITGKHREETYSRPSLDRCTYVRRTAFNFSAYLFLNGTRSRTRNPPEFHPRVYLPRLSAAVLPGRFAYKFC